MTEANRRTSVGNVEILALIASKRIFKITTKMIPAPITHFPIGKRRAKNQ